MKFGGKVNFADLFKSMFKSNHISYFRNLTDVTLADEDTNSILTDKVNRTIQGNVAMQL